MKTLTRMFASKEVKAVLGVLDEADQRFNCPIFERVKKQIEQEVLAHADDVTNLIVKGNSAREIVFTTITDITGDLVESGQFHIYRGVLNPMNGGEDLLRIYDAAVDELLQIGAVTKDHAANCKESLRRNIKNAG